MVSLTTGSLITVRRSVWEIALTRESQLRVLILIRREERRGSFFHGINSLLEGMHVKHRKERMLYFSRDHEAGSRYNLI